MKILHILEATQGGTRRHVLDLLPALVEQGVGCDLVYSPERYAAFRDDAARLEQRGVRCFELPMARGFGGARDAAALRGLRAVLRANRYDALHCHSTKAGFLGRLAAPWKMPVVYTPHCIAFDTSLPRLQRHAARLMEKLLAPRTARYIAVSQHEVKVLKRAGLCDNRVSLIYNGVNLEEFDNLQNHLLTPSPPHPLTIGCFGRLTRQKNQLALLRALPELLRAVPEARLVLVGSGEDEIELRQTARRLNVDGEIDFRGEVLEARPLYSECDIVAQPSRWEGCPYSTLEAMAARLPVVASAVGGVPELLPPSAGLAYHGEGNLMLAQHLVTLAADENRRHELGRAARERVEEFFTAQRMVAATAGVYRNLPGF